TTTPLPARPPSPTKRRVQSNNVRNSVTFAGASCTGGAGLAQAASRSGRARSGRKRIGVSLVYLRTTAKGFEPRRTTKEHEVDHRRGPVFVNFVALRVLWQLQLVHCVDFIVGVF